MNLIDDFGFSGATETPLRTPDQVVPGVILCGQHFANAWEVLSIEREDIWMQRLDGIAPPLADHVHNMQKRGGGMECACGLRMQPLKTFLPDAELIRTQVLTPTGALVVPDHYSVYATSDAQIVVKDVDRWTMTMPVIPKLMKIWTLPQVLRELIEHAGPAILDPPAAAPTPRRPAVLYTGTNTVVTGGGGGGGVAR